jgi:hypothetical protein
MRNGQCPNCQSIDVYVSADGAGIGEGFALRIRIGDGMLPTKKWATYLCVSCGYFENYITDAEKIARIVQDPAAAGWDRVR